MLVISLGCLALQALGLPLYLHQLYLGRDKLLAYLAAPYLA